MNNNGGYVMKQIERRYKNSEMTIECYPTFKEKIKILFSKGFGINIHLTHEGKDEEIVSLTNIDLY